MSFGPKNAAEAVVFAEENLVVDFQHALYSLLVASGMSQRDLAARADMKEAQVSHFFSSRANPTLKTVAKLFHALGDECVITSRRLEKERGSEHVAATWCVSDEPAPAEGAPSVTMSTAALAATTTAAMIQSVGEYEPLVPPCEDDGALAA